MPGNPYPYGIRQITLTPYVDAQGTVLANVSYPLPVAMTLGFSETEQYDELRGDDVLVAVHGRGAQVDWSLEAGGLPITPWSIITGGMVVEEGVSPNRKVRLRKSGDDQRPYFRIDGRSVSDSGGSVVCRLYRCKANGRIQADMRGGSFTTSNIDGIGLPLVNDAARWLYEFTELETDAPLTTTPEANPLPVPLSLTASNVLATSITLSWAAVTGATAYLVQRSVDNGVTWTAGTAPAGAATTAIQATLTANTNYQFRVAATTSAGTGSYCRPLLVKTAVS
jgi:hypothetical protein